MHFKDRNMIYFNSSHIWDWVCQGASECYRLYFPQQETNKVKMSEDFDVVSQAVEN